MKKSWLRKLGGFITALSLGLGVASSVIVEGKSHEAKAAVSNPCILNGKATVSGTTFTQNGMTYTIESTSNVYATSSNDASGTAGANQLHGGTSGGKTIMLKPNGYIYNNTAFPGKITQIRLKSGSGCSTSADAKFEIAFSSSKLTSDPSSWSIQSTHSSQNTIYTFPVSGDNTYFRIKSYGTKNVQVSIEITFDESGTGGGTGGGETGGGVKPTDLQEIAISGPNACVRPNGDSKTTTNNAYKGGTSGTKNFSYTVSNVPAKTTKLVIYAAAYGNDGSTTVEPGSNYSGNGETVCNDDGMSGNSPFTLSKSSIWDNTYRVEIPLSDVTSSKNISLSFSKRTAIWYTGCEVAPSKTPSSITLTNQKTTYYQGDSIVMPTVTVKYTDNSTADVTSKAVVENFSTSTTGSHTATIKYTENNTTVDASYTYIVNADTLSSISLSGSVSGTYNTSWDLSQVVVTGSYSSGNKTITGAELTTSSPKPTSYGSQTVTVTAKFGGKEVSKDFTVNIVRTGKTENDPLLASQALTKTSGEYYVEGVVAKVSGSYNSSYGNKNVFITDDGSYSSDTECFEFYRFKLTIILLK